MKSRIQKYIIISATVLLTVTLTSCEDWLNVLPKSEILASEQFADEVGYQDVLTGVYSSLAANALYGRELTFGLLSAMSQNYNLSSTSAYAYAAKYDYTNSSVKDYSKAIWSGMYNNIVTLDLLLENIDKTDKSIFTDNNKDIIKGEALGLRGFLHFDLLRLYAPSYAANPNALAIPYVTEYTTKITGQSTVSEVMNKIIVDLTEAIQLLKKDPFFTIRADSAYNVSKRKIYFNYFAAKATLARVYLYKGDYAKALKEAQDVLVEERRFLWVYQNSVETSNSSERDRIFKDEHIFRLDEQNMAISVKGYLTSSAGSNALAMSDQNIAEIFESADGLNIDWRQTYLIESDGATKFCSKFWQFDNSPYSKIMPLIRKTELYYIVAECLKTSDPTNAIAALNTVRDNRNLGSLPLSGSLSADDIQKEIFKEYRKEFLGEGQLFFYYKRLNLDKIEGANVSAKSVYVMPMPDDEIEFGFRK